MKYQLTITKADNGFILTHQEKIDGDIIEHEQVIEETEEGELECTKNMLLAVKEHFGIFYNKHDKENLVIEIKTNEEKQ